MNWKLWLEGLGFAALNGGAGGAIQSVTNGGHINTGTAVAAGIGALLGAIAYLKQPANNNTTDTSAITGQISASQISAGNIPTIGKNQN